ncbi:MAG: hypothetical protein AB7G06_02265 [Bdellovibrionales bacterium]
MIPSDLTDAIDRHLAGDRQAHHDIYYATQGHAESMKAFLLARAASRTAQGKRQQRMVEQAKEIAAHRPQGYRLRRSKAVSRARALLRELGR